MEIGSFYATPESVFLIMVCPLSQIAFTTYRKTKRYSITVVWSLVTGCEQTIDDAIAKSLHLGYITILSQF